MKDRTMQTANLIDALSERVVPVSPQSAVRALAPALAAGAAGTLAAVVSLYGVQPGLDTAAGMTPLAMKLGYAGGLGAVAIVLLAALARPGAAPRSAQWLAAPFAALAVLAAYRISAGEGLQAWLGATWALCPLRIVALSIPIAAALTFAVRTQAPTELRKAGVMLGLTSGAIAACLYALACTEPGASFVLTWYTLGIGLCAALGWLFGPRLLRW